MLLAQKGYFLQILGDETTLGTIYKLLFEKNFIRIYAVKALRALSYCSAKITSLLVESGLIRTISNNLTTFKEYDEVLQVYNYVGHYSNLSFFDRLPVHFERNSCEGLFDQ
eukprot:TRINITY_DN10299_c0_g1_i1.p1 TRINITY_DN10299_c0_g1~~TRINITY_DN10299_c0_g1_i1.p1  ORF type:complete len:111 (+),score=1.15 TRINITY_DN10299_c0_g1_i1:340-672(+)